MAISKVIAKNLFETCPLTEDRILIHHNGVDLKRFDPEKVNREKVRDEFNLKQNQIAIGMLARFSPGKGHEEFLFAARELNKKYKNLFFLIVGEASHGENEYADSIKKLAEEHQIENIIFTGYRSDVPEVLSALDIFVFPSHSEAFGIALIEAMAMGLPSVCSNSDGVLDIAIDSETSYLFERKNGEDLKDKISLLIDSPETRMKFSVASRKRVENNFDLEIIINQLIEIYKSSIN